MNHSISAFEWIRRNLFGGVGNTLVTLTLLAVILLFALPLIRWLFLDSVWTGDSADACADALGACWAVVANKYRVMLFGVYPYDEHYRAGISIFVYAAAVALSCIPRFWKIHLLAGIWIAALGLILVVLYGGIGGLPRVPTNQWGGLPLTLLIFAFSVLCGMPIAILLALARTSGFPVLRVLATLLVEGVRALPLVTVLFFAAVVLPIFLPPGVDIAKVVRVTFAMSVFFACYQAEAIRAGLQGIPKEQYEAANALGLSYWQRMRRVVLPQAMRLVIPALMNQNIASFKDTTLVIIVGLYDLLTATTAVVSEPEWRRYFTEAYLFVALVYFFFGYAMSKYSRYLERRFRYGRTVASAAK